MVSVARTLSAQRQHDSFHSHQRRSANSNVIDSRNGDEPVMGSFPQKDDCTSITVLMEGQHVSGLRETGDSVA